MKERQRIELWEEYDGCCAECGRPAAEADHVRPRSSLPGKRLRAERDGKENLKPLCVMCHRQKNSNMWRNPEPKQEPPRWGGL
jgi:5-methylcytosine-specific restriction endonuclease McrA